MPALSALAGAASRLPFGANFWPTCVGWFLGDATAALALTPTLLLLVPGLVAGIEGSSPSFFLADFVNPRLPLLHIFLASCRILASHPVRARPHFDPSCHNTSANRSIDRDFVARACVHRISLCFSRKIFWLRHSSLSTARRSAMRIATLARRMVAGRFPRMLHITAYFRCSCFSFPLLVERARR